MCTAQTKTPSDQNPSTLTCNHLVLITLFFTTPFLSREHFPFIKRIGMQVSQEGSVDSKTAQKQGEEWHFRITFSDSCATGSEQELDARRKASAAKSKEGCEGGVGAGQEGGEGAAGSGDWFA